MAPDAIASLYLSSRAQRSDPQAQRSPTRIPAHCDRRSAHVPRRPLAGSSLTSLRGGPSAGLLACGRVGVGRAHMLAQRSGVRCRAKSRRRRPQGAGGHERRSEHPGAGRCSGSLRCARDDGVRLAMTIQRTTGSGSRRMPKRSYTLVWMALAKVITSPPVHGFSAPPTFTNTKACFS